MSSPLNILPHNCLGVSPEFKDQCKVRKIETIRVVNISRALIIISPNPIVALFVGYRVQLIPSCCLSLSICHWQLKDRFPNFVRYLSSLSGERQRKMRRYYLVATLCVSSSKVRVMSELSLAWLENRNSTHSEEMHRWHLWLSWCPDQWGNKQNTETHAQLWLPKLHS